MNAADIQGQLIAGAFDIWPFTLLVYDHLLTLEWEISRYWGEAFTLTVPNVLFFANRYGTLFGNIPVIIPYFWNSQSLTGRITTCGLSFCLVNPDKLTVLVGVMLFLRTYALYERSKRVLVLMLGVAVGTVAVGLTSDDTSINPYFGCNFTTSRSEGNSLAVAWAGVTIFDSTIFLLTLYRVFGRHRANEPDLFTILLRDGSLYFGVMVMSNLVNILTLVIGNPYSRGIATTFTNIISSIMITRLMLNLRDPALAHMSGRLPQSTTTTGNDWFAGDTVAGGSPVLDTNLDIELPERKAVPSDSRTLNAVLIHRLRSITIPLHSTTLDSCSQVEQRSHAARRDPRVASYEPHQDSSICAPTAKTRLTGPLLQTTPLYFFVIKEHYSLLVLRRPAAPKHLRRDS
ncbi:hypothetical protein B0H14DRAFT_3853217 [Mycena olivaceomarginata]|nr:hypothetical protein B0H14DRAFT_3853217 [Mycena olivaceomarginata]